MCFGESYSLLQHKEFLLRLTLLKEEAKRSG